MRRISVHVVRGVVLCSMIARTGSAQTNTQALKRLSLDDLTNVEVTLVSRRPEKLFEAASAIQVLSREDIHRSGASTLAGCEDIATSAHAPLVPRFSTRYCAVEDSVRVAVGSTLIE